MRRCILAVAAGLALLLVASELSAIPHGITLGLYRSQDRIAALVQLAALVLALLLAWKVPRIGFALSLRSAMVLALVLAFLLWVGSHAVTGGYAFTRDEQMALFDAAIFREGWLVAPVPQQWRAMVAAMAPLFLMPADGNAAWASAYLPVNAMMRAGFGMVADPALMNPLLAGAGAILVFTIGRRLFPASRSAAAVAFLLYATSAQMAVAAMTPFAMTAHMTLNLIWLALFLRGGRGGHAGAALVGFLATGLHQIVFHPLFVLPFLDHLRRRGEWRAAIFYVAVYAAAGLFWILYPGLALHSAGAAPAPGAGGGGLGNFIEDRVLPLVLSHDPATLPLMGFNLLRFAAWQNAALLPLCLCAWPAVRRAEGIARPLLYGILLTVAAMVFLLPYQSIGWGYRYLHGLLGSFALLAGYGWNAIADGAPKRRLLAIGTAITLAASGPWLVWQTHRLIAPAARVDRAIAAIDADFVIVDSPGLGMDQVRNDPFLRNRPLRFSAQLLGDRELDVLCARGRVAFIPRQVMVARGLGAMGDMDQARFRAMQERLSGRPCTDRK